MLGDKRGTIDRNALADLIKDIKRNTKLSEEDAAVIAASKVNNNLIIRSCSSLKV